MIQGECDVVVIVSKYRIVTKVEKAFHHDPTTLWNKDEILINLIDR